MQRLRIRPPEIETIKIAQHKPWSWLVVSASPAHRTPSQPSPERSRYRDSIGSLQGAHRWLARLIQAGGEHSNRKKILTLWVLEPECASFGHTSLKHTHVAFLACARAMRRRGARAHAFSVLKLNNACVRCVDGNASSTDSKGSNTPCHSTC